MQPSYLSLVQVFGPPARYTVPLFQRPYVWNQEEQWDPLWDDIMHLADRVFAAERGKPVAGHFLGTVVLEQAQTLTGSISCREIIDGQQRLTTLQILLKAAEHVLAEAQPLAAEAKHSSASKEIGVAARQIAILTGNAAYAEDEERYKVWPTNDDRLAFRQIMDAKDATSVPEHTPRMAQAYHFFRLSIRDWLGDGAQIAARASALAAALQSHLRLIVLDLEDSDEPQAIFETLNAHGTPLLPADLIKNWLLWEATRQNLKNMDNLYQSYWRVFDRDPDYWRTKIGTGHAARARVDTFLQNWLTRRTSDVIAAKHLYNQFLAHVATRQSDGTNPPPCDVPALMQDIYQDGLCYREIEQPTGSTRFDRFLRRLPAIDIVVFHPVLLALMRRPGSDQADRDAAVTALESYLIRRFVCWDQTRGYATVMRNVLLALSQTDPTAPATPVIAKALAEQSAAAYRWPDDEKFGKSWRGNRWYGGYRRSRVLMVLQALEEHYLREGDKGEPIVTFDFSGLEIEHILPQKWEHHWPLPSGDDARKAREDRLHRIGNLTLVTSKLNPTLSNASWLGPNGKCNTFGHSKLQLNARLVKSWPSTWDETAIDARATALFEAACKIWPPPPSAGVT